MNRLRQIYMAKNLRDKTTNNNYGMEMVGNCVYNFLREIKKK